MRVAVAVPCTDRKRGGQAMPEAMLRNVSVDLSISERVDQWVDRLLNERDRGVNPPLAELYVGPGWRASMQLVAGVKEAVESGVDGFVISAGLGLQRLDDEVRGWPRYSATFASRHPDSVVVGSRDQQRLATEWWSSLGRSEMLGGTTFVELSSSHDAVVVAASASYLRATAEDLVAAAQSGLRVVAFTASPVGLGDLDSYVIRIDARARSVVTASDARATADFVAFAARRLGEELLDIAAARRFVTGILEGRTAPPRPRGAAARPDEVRSFIEASLRADPELRKAPLLRRWRDEGRAFEQKRFGAIYDEVAGVMRGQRSDAGKGAADV